LLVLDGWLHLQDGSCLPKAVELRSTAILDLLSDKLASSNLRAEEALRICHPNLDDCSLGVIRSAALIDQSDEYRANGAWSLLSTVIVIILMLLYIYILNMKISKFSKTLLQPLRALLDDMVVLSSLELADIDDEELPIDVAGVNAENVAEELQHLQDSFKTMRNAIRSWSKYVPPAIVSRLFSAGLEAKIGVVKTQATILFCDINGFEACCQDLSPEEVLDMLSMVTGTIADVIHRNEGTLLEFIGDEVLAVFNTPRPQKNHVYLAVATSLQIHAAMKGLTYSAQVREIPIQCRCGVHSGPIFAGNIGSHNRMKYGLLGDGINLTARLKGLNSRYNTLTLASEHVVHEAREHRLLFRPVDLVAVKGKTEPTVVYETMMPGCAQRARSVAVRHAEGFRLYQQRKFAEAQEAFQEVSAALEANSAGERDTPSRMLASRCDGYLRCPPPPDWDGVERLVKKSFEEAVAPVDAEAQLSPEALAKQGFGSGEASEAADVSTCYTPAKQGAGCETDGNTFRSIDGMEGETEEASGGELNAVVQKGEFAGSASTTTKAGCVEAKRHAAPASQEQLAGEGDSCWTDGFRVSTL